MTSRTIITALAALTVASAMSATNTELKLQPVTLAVTGMTWGGCASAVQSGIATIKPILDLDVSIDTKLARLKFDSKKVSLQELIGTVKESGKRFDATLVMHATGEESAIKSAREGILKLKGVAKVSQVDKDGNLRITFEKKGKTMLASIVDAAKKVKVTLKDPKPKKDK